MISKPSNIEAEAQLLVTILKNKDRAYDAMERISSDAFLDDRHQKIFQACESLLNKNLSITKIGLIEELKKLEFFEFDYIEELTKLQPINFEQNIEIVSGKALLNNMSSLGMDMVAEAGDDSADGMELLAKYSKKIDSLSNIKQKNIKKIGEIAIEYAKKADEIIKSGNKITGVRSGYAQVDHTIGGFHNSELIILAARPSVGKTTFAMNIAKNALKDNIGVAFFSLEMGEESIGQKFISMQSKINSNKLRKYNVKDEFELLLKTTQELRADNINIIDCPGLTTFDLRCKVRYLKNKENVGLVIIDYLGLLKLRKKRIENRLQEVSEIVRDVKAIAKDLDIPIILLAQLNRKLEDRVDKSPVLSDLKETGEVEQTADVVMFLHRADYFDKTKEATDSAGNPLPSKVDIFVEKNRNGPTGACALMFDKKISKFYSIDS